MTTPIRPPGYARAMALDDFLSQLRRFDPCQVVDVGRDLHWRWRTQRGGRPDNENARIVETIGPRVMAFALGQPIGRHGIAPSPRDFVSLCATLLNADEETTAAPFLDEQALAVREILVGHNRFPGHLATPNIIRSLAIPITMARVFGSQSRTQAGDRYDLARQYALIMDMNAVDGGRTEAAIHSLFGMPYMAAHRSAFAALALAMDKRGAVTWGSAVPPALAETAGIDDATIAGVCGALSCRIEDFHVWVEGVSSSRAAYHAYFDDPLSEYPMIAGSGDPPTSYLIPVPTLFFRALRFRTLALLESARRGGETFSKAYGDALERHVCKGLTHFFGDRLSRPHRRDSRSADFVIQLDGLTVVIELKKQLTSRRMRCAMTPQDIATALIEANDAFSQINLTAADYKRPVFGIILIDEDLGSEAMPFFHFARVTGLLEQSSVDRLEIISWPDLEARLLKSSLPALERTLMGRLSATVNDGNFLTQARWTRDRTGPKGGPPYLAQAQREYLGFLDRVR